MKDLFKKHKKIIIPSILLYAFLIVALIVPIKAYSIDLPGNINQISGEIIIDDIENSEEFYSIYILSYNGPTLFQMLIGNLNKEVNVYKDNKVLSNKENFNRGQILEDLSFQYAIINAYSEASKVDSNITIHYELESYIFSYSRNENLKMGDKFTHINGISINELTFKEVDEYFVNNDELNLTMIDGKEVRIEKTDGKFGIIYDPFYNIINSYPTYKTFYEDDNKGGPSGGLLQALNIYATLTNKRLNKVISGTGTIEPDGTVGAIGGVVQKIYTANKKVDIFFCPPANYEDAKTAYNSIKNPTYELIEVSNFNEAIKKLFWASKRNN